MKRLSPSCAMLAVLVAALPAARAAEPGGQESPAVETTVEVRRVVWPVLVEPRAGVDRDACTDMTPDDVVVTEAGLPVRVTAVAPGRPRTLHAIVIDVSGSMAGRLVEARSAAIDYVDALPGDEPAALWAFSDEVRLLAPPGTDRARLRRAIVRLQPVHGTALWDALRFVLEMLAAWPDRKAILLVTDGADSTSLADDAESRAFAALRHEDPVTVFPLTLDMSSRADRGPRAPLASLRRLAAETGGSLIDVPDAAHFRRALDDIRRRLDAEWTVTWTAAAPAPGTPRPVRIRARRGAPCRVRSAGPRLRVPSPPPLPPPRRVRLDPAAWRRAGWDDPPPATALRLAPVPGWPGEPAWLAAASGPAPRRGALSWHAVVEERGLLLDPRRQRPGRPARTRDVRRAAFARRTVALLVPPLDELLAGPDDPADAIAAAEDAGIDLLPRGPVDRADALAPVWWDASTFLAHRLALADGLAAAREDLARFARERIAAMRLRELVELETAAGSPPDPARRRVLARAAEAAADAAPAAERARFLAAWLPDVDALDVALELERRALLASGAGADRWLALRERLAVALPLPFHRRSVVLGMPRYDRERDVIGFQPIQLARLTMGSRLDGAIPPLPVAYLAVRRVRAAGGALAGLAPSALRLVPFDPPRGRLALWGRSLLGRGGGRWIVEVATTRSGTPLRALVRITGNPGRKPSLDVLCVAPSDADDAAVLERAGLLCQPRWKKRLAERAGSG